MDYLISSLDQVRPLLVNFRKKAGLSQAAVAARLGISQQAYARMEAHPTDASVTRLFTVLQLLGATVAFGQALPAAPRRIEGLVGMSPYTRQAGASEPALVTEAGPATCD